MQTLTYRQTGFSSSGNNLFKRNANDFGVTWGGSISASTTSSSSVNGGTQVFNNLKTIVTSFGQFTMGSVSLPSLQNDAPPVVNRNEVLTISPNPVSNVFNLIYKTGKEVTDTWLTIENVAGKQILNKKINTASGVYTESINVSGFSSGVYVLKIGSSAAKFVKQ